MKDTNSLLKIAQGKLLEVQKSYEENSKKLKDLIEQRGVLRASEAIGEIVETDKLKIKKLSAEIEKLKNELEEAGTPLISGLKGKILSLKSKAEKEQKLENEKQQNRIEEKMARISKELISILEKSNKMNSELQSLYASWKGLAEKTGQMLFSKKIIQPSEMMLNLIYGVLKNEWDGKGGKGRQFYNRIPI